MPVNVVPDGERPLGEARTCNPLGGKVGAYHVHILTAPHHQVAGTEERAGDVVKGYAAGAQGVEARRGVAAVGQH